jgi:hypothetical protein
MKVPIHQVLENGTARLLGHWFHHHRRLELDCAGFPLLPAGSHVLEGDLPWLFWDMCPSGFLGKRFARVERQLALNADPRTWSRDDALRALTEAGHELTGNLLVGDRAIARWREDRDRAESLDPRPWDPPGGIDEWLASGEEGASSSLGGERPKLAVRTPSGGSLVKFSPPVPPPSTPSWDARRPSLEAAGRSLPAGSPQAQRWADLLRVEAHCAQTLRACGVNAVEASAAWALTGRVLLEVVRFDRTPQGGRRGAATLYWYAMERLGDVNLPAPRVIAALVEDGHLRTQDLLLVERVHAFSAAIGNTDAHLGNYGLVFDEEGRASLAPFYDILPMALAPANDELPDARLVRRPRQVVDATVSSWVDELVRRVSADEEIDQAFRELWFTVIGV